MGYHELSFVLGHLANIKAIDALLKVLENSKYHDVVRHEAAIALGNILCEEQAQGSTEKLTPVFMKYIANFKISELIRESCQVALVRMCDAHVKDEDIMKPKSEDEEYDSREIEEIKSSDEEQKHSNERDEVQ